MDPQSREARQGVAKHLKTDPGPPGPERIPRQAGSLSLHSGRRV